jgi:hypothetical protein
LYKQVVVVVLGHDKPPSATWGWSHDFGRIVVFVTLVTLDVPRPRGVDENSTLEATGEILPFDFPLGSGAFCISVEVDTAIRDVLNRVAWVAAMFNDVCSTRDFVCAEKMFEDHDIPEFNTVRTDRAAESRDRVLIFAFTVQSELRH